MIDIQETTMTVYTVGNERFASREDALAAAAQARNTSLVEKYIADSGAVGRNATRIRTSILHWERWKALQEA